MAKFPDYNKERDVQVLNSTNAQIAQLRSEDLQGTPCLHLINGE